MLLKIKDRPFEGTEDGLLEVGCFSQGYEAYAKVRDESGEGASTFPDGELLGQRHYRISYNGKVWDGDECVYNPYL